MGGGTFFLLNIRHTYPTMVKLDTVIPYLRKRKKMHKSRDTFFSSADMSIFFFFFWSWFKFNNLGSALGKNLKFCTSLSKGLKLKVRKF